MSLNGNCSICTESIEEDAAATKCGHTYHYSCIVEWVQQSSSCPKCRLVIEATGIIKLFVDHPDENSTSTSYRASKFDGSLESDISQQLNIAEKEQIQILTKQPEVNTEEVRVIRQSQTTSTLTYMNSFYDVDVTKETLKLLSEMSELPNFKKLEKEEKRQFKWNAFKQKFESQHQEDKLKDEKKTLKKSYDEKIEKLVHNRKKKIEDLTKEQEKEVEKLAKKAKEEQERELRKVYGRFQNEQKVLKDEVDKLPKSERKELLKTKKEELDKIQEHKEQELLRTLELNNEFVIATIREKFHTNLAMIDQDFFERKYLLIKAMNSALLELEEKQIVDKKIFAEQQIKKEFKLKQTQQEYRYEKENEHIRKENRLQEESLTNQLDQDRRELTTRLIKESNERIARFKELHQEATSENWLKSLDEYEEKERQIFQFSISDHESRCKMRLEGHRKKNMAMLRELEKIHIEKRQLLQNEELARLAQSEKEFQSNLLIYRANVPARLQKMDEELNNL